MSKTSWPEKCQVYRSSLQNLITSLIPSISHPLMELTFAVSLSDIYSYVLSRSLPLSSFTKSQNKETEDMCRHVLDLLLMMTDDADILTDLAW